VGVLNQDPHFCLIMRLDELNQPLRKRSLFSRLWEKRPGLLFCAYVAALGGMGGGGWWAVQQKNPFAGEPVVMVSIPPAEEIATASTTPVAEAAAEPEAAAVSVDEAAAEPVSDEPAQSEEINVTVDEPVQQDTYRQEANIIVSPHRPLTPSPQTMITETTEWGPLPKVSSGGDKASSIYARKTSMNVLHSDSPKIALLLGGMGLNRKLTQKAIKELPSDITLAFAPYGTDLQEQVDKARNQGHEVFLQVPLEPVGYPASNPGPKTLVGDAADAENINFLRWHMSRFHGYAGVVNYMGGRFLAMPKAMKPMLSELKQRGVLFLEDGSMALSSTETAAKMAKTQVRRAKVVIDANPSPQAIISALTLLEEQATGTGFAIGTGSGLEVTIDTVNEWAKAAAERGIILVPISAAYKGRQG
jgi:uncharacterized protein